MIYILFSFRSLPTQVPSFPCMFSHVPSFLLPSMDFLFNLFHLRVASCICISFLVYIYIYVYVYIYILFFIQSYWMISFMFVHVSQSELTYLIYWVSLLFIGFSFWRIFKSDWLTDSQTDWLTDWRTDRLTDWLTDWLTGRLNHSLNHSFIDIQWFSYTQDFLDS